MRTPLSTTCSNSATASPVEVGAACTTAEITAEAFAGADERGSSSKTSSSESVMFAAAAAASALIAIAALRSAAGVGAG